MGEFLFATENSQHLDEWVNKISFHAALSPAQQLLSYDSYKRAPPPPPPVVVEVTAPPAPPAPLARTGAPIRPISSGDETWMKLNNASYAEVGGSSAYNRTSLPATATPYEIRSSGGHPSAAGLRPTSAGEFRGGDTSSESDVPVPSPREDKKKESAKSKNSVLGIFRRRSNKPPHV